MGVWGFRGLVRPDRGCFLRRPVDVPGGGRHASGSEVALRAPGRRGRGCSPHRWIFSWLRPSQRCLTYPLQPQTPIPRPLLASDGIGRAPLAPVLGEPRMVDLGALAVTVTAVRRQSTLVRRRRDGSRPRGSVAHRSLDRARANRGRRCSGCGRRAWRPRATPRARSVRPSI